MLQDMDSLNDNSTKLMLAGYSDTGLLQPLICDAWVRVQLGERHNSSTDFTSKPSQLSSSASKHPVIFKKQTQRKPQAKYKCMSSILVPSPMYEIKIKQKDWNRPPNMLKKKASKFHMSYPKISFM
jgi:hypothetical protein